MERRLKHYRLIVNIVICILPIVILINQYTAGGDTNHESGKPDKALHYEDYNENTESASDYEEIEHEPDEQPQNGVSEENPTSEPEISSIEHTDSLDSDDSMLLNPEASSSEFPADLPSGENSPPDILNTGSANDIPPGENTLLYPEMLNAEPYADLAVNERVVYNYAELKNALSNDNGITAVYFGSSITMELTGIRIHPNKVNILIDGINPLDPGQTQPYTLTDYSSLAFTDTIYVNAAGPKTLHIRDLNITGKNYYGPFSIIDASSQANLTVTYERVDYNGPQIGYHRNGLIRFIDCSVRIHGDNGGSPNQEFSEAKHLLFEGANTIDTVSGTRSVFWHPLGGSFTIANDSSLTLKSSNTSSEYGVFYADSSYYKIDISIGARSDFDANITAELAPALFSTLNSLNISEAGAFRLTASGSPNEPVLSMGGNLTVDKDGAFIIKGIGSASYSVLAQKKGDITVNKDAVFHIISSGTYPSLINLEGRGFIINDPASVLLSNSGRAIEASSSAGSIHVEAEQINYWNALSGGGLDEPPLYRWKKSGTDNFSIDGTLNTGSSGNFSVLTSNYGQGDIGVMPDKDNFSMVNARVLAFGRLELIVAAPPVNASRITGVTAPGATVRASFSQQGVDYTPSDIQADAEGVFHIDTGVPLESPTVITVVSNYRYLTSSAEVTVVENGTLELTIPERMEFFDTEISLDNKLAKRLDPDWHIVVSDTRGVNSKWNLYARLIQPLTPSDATKPVLTGALFFADDTITPLDSEKLLIYSHVTSSGDDITKIHWQEDRGILIDIPINIVYSGIRYTAVIEWTLADVP